MERHFVPARVTHSDGRSEDAIAELVGDPFGFPTMASVSDLDGNPISLHTCEVNIVLTRTLTDG